MSDTSYWVMWGSICASVFVAGFFLGQAMSHGGKPQQLPVPHPTFNCVFVGAEPSPDGPVTLYAKCVAG